MVLISLLMQLLHARQLGMLREERQLHQTLASSATPRRPAFQPANHRTPLSLSQRFMSVALSSSSDLRSLGYVEPRHSTQIATSPWRVQSGDNERVRDFGSSRVANWLPWHPQEYTPVPARVALCTPGLEFQEPVFVDLLTGEVTKRSAPVVANGLGGFRNLPLQDYPYADAERIEVGLAGLPSSLLRCPPSGR